MFHLVSVRQNLVEEVSRRHCLVENQSLLKTNLEAGVLLSQKFRETGCIDGDYWFDDAQRAKMFASVCMDFIMKLIRSRADAIEQLNHQDDFIAGNRHKTK